MRRSATILLLALAPAVSMARAQSAAAPASPPNAPAPAAAPSAPQGPPDTEIFVADLSRESGVWRVERPRNVTKRAGYDNQPWFLPDGTHLLYTSLRPGPGAEQTDIFEIDLVSAREQQVTATPESEYSPQLSRDGKAVLVVRVEDAEANEKSPGSAQRLWRFPLDGSGSPVVVAPAVRGVGYHAWSDENTVAVFVLGDPFTLQLVDLGQGESATGKTIASHVGRSIHRVPRTNDVSYVAPDGDARAIFAFDPATGASRRIAPAPPTEEGDYAWTPDGALLAAVGATIHRLEPGPDASWKPIAELAGDGVGTISRIAVSPIGDRIAFVAVR